MNGKVIVGGSLNLNKDIPELIEWLEKRVDKRSKQPIDMVFLPLLVAEIETLIVKEHWSYNEDFDDAIVGVKVMAKNMAKSIIRRFRE